MRLVCHRVIGIGGDDIHTQGDHARAPDPPIRRQDILGKVTAVIRGRRRFTTAVIPEASCTGVFRMYMDLLLSGLWNRLHTAALHGAAFLKQRARVRNIAAFTLRKCVRFDIGIRAPIRTVRAYRFVPFHRFPFNACSSDDLIVLARLGRYPLGTFNPLSGEMQIRRVAAGLGLEEFFRDLQQKIR